MLSSKRYRIPFCLSLYRLRMDQKSLFLNWEQVIHFQDQWIIQLISNPQAQMFGFLLFCLSLVLCRQCSSGAGISSTSELSMHLGSQVSRWENRGEKRELITTSCPGRQSAVHTRCCCNCWLPLLGQLQISVFVVVLMIIPQLTWYGSSSHQLNIKINLLL